MRHRRISQAVHTTRSQHGPPWGWQSPAGFDVVVFLINLFGILRLHSAFPPAQPDSVGVKLTAGLFASIFQNPAQLNTKCCDDTSDGRCFALNNIVLRPCCFGNRGRSKLLTQSQCTFRAGSWSEDAQLCSDVSCLQKTCELKTSSELATKPHPQDSELEDPGQGERFILPLFFHAGFIHYVS